MEENLTKLVEYTIPGDEQRLIVSGSDSRLYTSYNPPMEFLSSNGVGYEMALYRLETYFSFPNIISNNNSIRMSIDNGKNWHDLKIPIGCYDINAINEVLQRLLPNKSNDGKVKVPYVVLSGNKNTFKCVLEVMKDTTIVDFDIDNSIRSVLGFEAKKYKGGEQRYESENKVNILNVNSILVHCDIIKPSRVNGMFAPVIYNFSPNVTPGAKIVSQPQHLSYIPLTMNVIPTITAWVTDQNGKILDLRGEVLTLTFHIRKRR